MANVDAKEKSTYAQLPSNVWWSLRQRLIQTPGLTIDESFFVASMSLKQSAGRQYVAELKNNWSY